MLNSETHICCSRCYSIVNCKEQCKRMGDLLHKLNCISFQREFVFSSGGQWGRQKWNRKSFLLCNFQQSQLIAIFGSCHNTNNYNSTKPLRIAQTSFPSNLPTHNSKRVRHSGAWYLSKGYSCNDLCDGKGIQKLFGRGKKATSETEYTSRSQLV
jgi:hypothetical protein